MAVFVTLVLGICSLLHFGSNTDAKATINNGDGRTSFPPESDKYDLEKAIAKSEDHNLYTMTSISLTPRPDSIITASTLDITSCELPEVIEDQEPSPIASSLSSQQTDIIVATITPAPPDNNIGRSASLVHLRSNSNKNRAETKSKGRKGNQRGLRIFTDATNPISKGVVAVGDDQKSTVLKVKQLQVPAGQHRFLSIDPRAQVSRWSLTTSSDTTTSTTRGLVKSRWSESTKTDVSDGSRANTSTSSAGGRRIRESNGGISQK